LLETIRTSIDRQETSELPVLPEALRIAYGDDLRCPPSGPQRPYVIGNFVSAIYGVSSYEIAGKSGGGDINGFDEPDRFISGLLRASADAVMVGSGTLHQTAPEHLRRAFGMNDLITVSVFGAARNPLSVSLC
jgi:hypothetical protein